MKVTFPQAKLDREVPLRVTELLDGVLQGADVPLQDDLQHKTNTPQRGNTLVRGQQVKKHFTVLSLHRRKML